MPVLSQESRDESQDKFCEGPGPQGLGFSFGLFFWNVQRAGEGGSGELGVVQTKGADFTGEHLKFRGDGRNGGRELKIRSWRRRGSGGSGVRPGKADDKEYQQNRESNSGKDYPDSPWGLHGSWRRMLAASSNSR